MTIDFGQLLQGQVYAFLLVFARIGSILISMPGIGENFVPARTRLLLALMISLILLSFIGPNLPALPSSVAMIAQHITIEIFIGLFIGLIARLLLSTLEVAGMLISLQIGLSNAMILNPTLAAQGSITGAMMSMIGVVVIFESGLIDMIMKSFLISYTTFKPTVMFLTGDMAEFLSHTVNDSFSLALRLVAPFMVLGIVFQLTSGLIVKMIPQMQIFFVVAPLQIIFGLAIFAVSISAIMQVWTQGFENIYTRIFTG
jgi:flagellar biosynthetic protein FliR